MVDETMKAAVYFGPQDIRVVDWSKPIPHSGDVLVKVLAASICGTDLRIYHGGHSAYDADTRRVPGHEIVGEIAALGPDVTGFETGQRVFVAPNMGCGHCEHCVTGNNNRCRVLQAIGVTMDGGFAEFVRVPAIGVQQGCLIPFSKEADPAIGALIEPLACVLRAQEAISVGMNDSVLVIGAGPIGIMHAKLAKVRGASRVFISELVESRRNQAKKLGADLVIDPTQQDLDQVLKKATDRKGPDVIIVAAPAHRAQEQALELAAVGGRISFFGGLPKDKPLINCHANHVHYKELIISGTTASSTDNCRQAAALINTGLIDLSGVVNARFPLAMAEEAFQTAKERHALKVVLEP